MKVAYKVRGSHRTARQIEQLLGRSPQIHSGMAGRGAFYVVVNSEEHAILSAAGINIRKKAGYR